MKRKMKAARPKIFNSFDKQFRQMLTEKKNPKEWQLLLSRKILKRDKWLHGHARAGGQADKCSISLPNLPDGQVGSGK